MATKFNGGLIRPDGHSAQYVTYKDVPCPYHNSYLSGCVYCMMGNMQEITHTISLGGDILALIVDREDNNSLIDWITAETYWETAQTLAHGGTVIISQSAWGMVDKPQSLVAVMNEAILYADCFGE